jgi:hypothetical protein
MNKILAAIVKQALPIMLIEQIRLLIYPIYPIDLNMVSNSSLMRRSAITFNTEEHLFLK